VRTHEVLLFFFYFLEQQHSIVNRNSRWVVLGDNIMFKSGLERMARPTYRRLSFVATFLRVVGSTIIIFCISVSILTAITGTSGNTAGEIFSRLVSADRFIAALAGGIFAFAFGELLSALRDISLNARALISSNESILQLLDASRPELSETPQSHYDAREASSPRGAASSAERDIIANVTTQPCDSGPASRQNGHDASSPYDAGLAARDIIATLMSKWCDSGRPSLTLAKTLIDAGVVQVARERGPKAAAAILEELKAEM
jgi:hypothetical protein